MVETVSTCLVRLKNNGCLVGWCGRVVNLFFVVFIVVFTDMEKFFQQCDPGEFFLAVFGFKFSLVFEASFVCVFEYVSCLFDEEGVNEEHGWAKLSIAN